MRTVSPHVLRKLRTLVFTFGIGLSALAVLPQTTADHGQNDAGSGGDAGDTLAAATSVTPFGEYTATISTEASDPNDYYTFSVPVGSQINIEIRDVLLGGGVFAPDNQKRLNFRLEGPNGVLVDTPNSNQGDTRVAIAAAPVAGPWYFHVTKGGGWSGNYRFCFIVVSGASHSCPDVGMRPIASFGDGSLRQATARVLLIPPQHGDLGNPLAGPTAAQYQATTLSALHKWETVLDAFAADYPQYSYLANIDVDVQIYDAGVPLQPHYDVVLQYVESGATAFRGAAADLGAIVVERYIVLSLFSSSPRGGQLVPDYPEINDIWTVTLHEFAHTFGLGHTLSWDATLGPDLMNSPATFPYGDGNPVGDGGERTPAGCISSLDLYGMAQIYSWMPSGVWQDHGGEAYTLPGTIPYELYC